ncbi:MAG: FtsQ-type POTRA domain-containing protein [Candidatus Margulisiibacteriota bacterium]
MKARSKRPRKKRRPRLGFILLLIFLILCGTAYLLSLPIWQIRDVVVNGVSMLSEKDVRAMAGVPISENLFYASLARAKSNLKKITAIKEVRFYRIPPATILINITERKPVAAIVFTGKSAVIDADGYIINHNANVDLNIPNMVNLPVITGLQEKDVLKAEKVGADLMRVVEDILLKLSPFLESKRLQLDMRDADAIELHLDDILLVKIGDEREIGRKMKVFEMLLKEIEGKWPRVEYIDVRLPSSPVIRYR